MTTSEAVEKLLNVARKEIGYHEGGNNYIKYAEGNWDNQFYGWDLQNQPWCDVFVDWCFCQAFGLQKGAAMTYQTVGSGSAACSVSALYYRAAGAYNSTPKAGDQIFFYVSGGINHTGIVEKVEGNNVVTIEGNTSDQVARRTYTLGSSQIAGYGHPKWSLVTEGSIDVPDDPMPSPSGDLTRILREGCKGEDVRDLQEKLIKLGYSCGPYGADGDFGSSTKQAVVQFQKDHKLEPVDGEVGPDTWKAINKALKEKEPPAPTTGFKRGDIVYFKGGKQYKTAIASDGSDATAGKAKVTLISKNSNTKHPYHIIHTDSESNVYGWVDADSIKKE